MLRKVITYLPCCLLIGLMLWLGARKLVAAKALHDEPSCTVSPTPPLPLPPLPHGSSVPGLPGDKNFVSGYVLLDGYPVTNAQVTLTVANQVTTTQTISGNFSLCPYFYVSLTHLDPTLQPEASLTLTASYAGRTRIVTTTVGFEGKRVDISLNMVALQIKGGRVHTCASLSNGIKCWGYNERGQVGDGTQTERHQPVNALKLTNRSDGSDGGENHSCALINGGAWCWGDNYTGTVGDGTNTHRWQPTRVEGLAAGVVAVTTGNLHSCALRKSGAVLCWGGGGHVPQSTLPMTVTGLTSGITALDAGYAHTCAVTTDGGVKCWGSNHKGELGDGTSGERRDVPDDVVGLQGITVQAVTAGGYFTCALTVEGEVLCWGANDEGQLGTLNTENQPTPVKVMTRDNVPLTGIKAISAGAEHTCALTTQGGVKCWGRNREGQLGNGTTDAKSFPVDVVGLSSGVKAIGVGYHHSCAVLLTGGAKCWGANAKGQLGDGTTVNRTTPVDVIGLIPPEPGPVTWTLFIYAAGDNNLADYLGETGTGMLAKLARSDPRANVQVGILFDGRGAKDSKYYVLTEGSELKAEKALGEATMDEPETLRDFLVWGFDRLPATYYYLAIVDHANGLLGIALDETSGNRNTAMLTPKELHDAIREASTPKGRRLHIIHFDGCSFGLFEDTSTVAGYTDYVIASPNTAWGVFAYPAYRQRASENSPNPRQLAEAIAQEYEKQVWTDEHRYPYTISVFDMAKYTNVLTTTDQLGKALAAYTTNITNSEILSRTRNGPTVQKYDTDDYQITNQDDIVDLPSLANALTSLNVAEITSGANAVLTATKEFIIYKQARDTSGDFQYLGITITVPLQNAQGLGIYYPHHRHDNDPVYKPYTDHTLFPNLPGDWGWFNFIKGSVPPGPSTPPPTLLEPITAAFRVFLPQNMR
ncbi:MAG: hypothetical protein DYG89_06490 [Caldilinea sp. CFX5]|nr:hypothetical protein [Caldilinea sp. CFX5]